MVQIEGRGRDDARVTVDGTSRSKRIVMRQSPTETARSRDLRAEEGVSQASRHVVRHGGPSCVGALVGSDHLEKAQEACAVVGAGKGVGELLGGVEERGSVFRGAARVDETLDEIDLSGCWVVMVEEGTDEAYGQAAGVLRG